MTLRVRRLSAAGAEYARARRAARLPPVRGAAALVPGRHGPVTVLCRGAEYTLTVAGKPAPSM